VKKGIAITLAMTFLVVFGAALSAQSQPRIGVCIYKFADTFMSYVRNQLEVAAVGKAWLSIQDSQYDQPMQNDQVDQFIAEGMKGLAINMVDPSAVSVIIDKAMSRNLPLVLFNREPEASDMARYDKAYYVGAKAQQSGTMEGQIVAQYWKTHPEADRNHDGVLEYVMLIGDPSNTDAKYRTEYSVRAVTAAGIRVLKIAEDTAMWDRPKAQEKMAAWLEAYGRKIEIVFANNDDMALGAIDALKADGYFRKGKYMPVVGVDATPPALDALNQGTLLGTVLNDTVKQGQATFDLVYALSIGRPAYTPIAPMANADGFADPKGHYVWVPYIKVTKDNYREFMKK